MNSMENSSVSEQLQNLRNKIRLSEAERKAMYNELENKKQTNENYIRQLQADISELNGFKLKEKQMAEKTYNRVLRSKELANAYKKKTLPEIMEEIEHQVFEQRKKLDLLMFKKKALIENLQSLAKHETRELKMTAEETANSSEAAKLRKLVSEVEKVKVKIQETKYVSQQYATIKIKLKEEQIWYKQQMELMEEEIVRWIIEKRQMSDIRDLAIQLRDDMLKDIADFERNMKKIKARFEEETKEVKNLEKDGRNEIIKALKRKSTPYSSRMWDEVLSQVKNPGQVSSEERELTSMVNFFYFIKDKTGISKPDDMITLFKNQEKTKGYLKEKEATAAAMLATVRKEDEELTEEFGQLKYTESQKYAKTFELIEKRKEEVADKEDEISAVLSELENIDKVNGNVRLVLEDLAKKFKIQTELPDDSNESVALLLAKCLEKCVELQSQCENVDPQDFLINSETPTPPPETEEIASEQFTTDDLGTLYGKFLTRNVVKQMSKQITVAHARAKKNYNPDYSTQKRRKVRTTFAKTA